MPGVMNVGLFTVSPEGAGWANIYRCPFESDNDRKIGGRQAVRCAWQNCVKQFVKNCLQQAWKV